MKCRRHEALRTELLALEVQPTASGAYRVDHKSGRFDDHVVAVSLAIMGALEREASFHLPAFGFSKSTDGTISPFGFAPLSLAW